MTIRKIVYGAGNRPGAAFQLKAFLQNTKHNVQVATYIKSATGTFVDWTLNACQNQTYLTKLLRDIDRFQPDLIISDNEPYVIDVAGMLGIPLWKCSPVHLIEGAVWERGDLSYTATLDKIRPILNANKGGRTFVYSPFCDIAMRPILKSGYEWMRPYYSIVEGVRAKRTAMLRDRNRLPTLEKILKFTDVKIVDTFEPTYSLLTTGDTDSVSWAFYNNSSICIAPDVHDPEAVINAILSKKYNLGVDLGQVELMGRYAVEEIEKAFERKPRTDYLSMHSNVKMLHERIDEI